MPQMNVDLEEWDSRAIQLQSNIELLVFEAVKGGYAINDTQGDIAIDNILVTAGRCREIVTVAPGQTTTADRGFENNNTVDLPWSCNFGPSADKETWCEFLPNDFGYVNWTLTDTQTPTLGTGPHASEIHQHAVYAYTERDEVFPGDVGYMVSPRFTHLNSHRCLTFNFHAYGLHIGSLAILDNHGNENWRHYGDPNIDNRFRHWQTQEVPLRPGQELFLVEAEAGGADFYADEGDLCVDDFEVELRDCRRAANDIYGLVYHCDFESDFCGGTTTSLGRSTSSSEELTGASSGARGSVYFAHRSSDSEQTSVFRANPLERECTYVIQFSYHIFGANTGMIKLLSSQNFGTTFAADRHSVTAIGGWIQSTSDGVGGGNSSSRVLSPDDLGYSHWHTATVRVQETTGFEFRLERDSNTGSKEEMALDEIEVIRTSCQSGHTPKPLMEDTRNLVFDCTFERDFCGLDLHGIVYRGRNTASENTGPDHGARHTRYFMYLEADAQWDSEVMGFDFRLKTHCRHSFDFSYYIYGENTQHLKLEAFGPYGLSNYLMIFRDGVPRRSMNASMPSYPQDFWGFPFWHTATEILHFTQTVSVRAHVQRANVPSGQENKGDIAFDELRVHRLSCIIPTTVKPTEKTTPYVFTTTPPPPTEPPTTLAPPTTTPDLTTSSVTDATDLTDSTLDPSLTESTPTTPTTTTATTTITFLPTTTPTTTPPTTTTTQPPTTPEPDTTPEPPETPAPPGNDTQTNDTVTDSTSTSTTVVLRTTTITYTPETFNPSTSDIDTRTPVTTSTTSNIVYSTTTVIDPGKANATNTTTFDDCVAGTNTVEGIDQSQDDDGDWLCGQSTELLPNSPEDHGGVLYLEGGEYFPDAFVEFTLQGGEGFECISFYYTISVNSVWLLFVAVYPGGDVFNSRYALTVVPETFEWVRVAGDIDVTTGDLISFGSVKTPASAGGNNGVMYIDDIAIYNVECRLINELNDAVLGPPVDTEEAFSLSLEISNLLGRKHSLVDSSAAGLRLGRENLLCLSILLFVSFLLRGS